MLMVQFIKAAIVLFYRLYCSTTPSSLVNITVLPCQWP